jgi:hypothetical protein
LNISLQDLIRTSKDQEIKPQKPLTIKEGRRQQEEGYMPEFNDDDMEVLEMRLGILQQEKVDVVQVRLVVNQICIEKL